jgi:prophage antirepressor-like protein
MSNAHLATYSSDACKTSQYDVDIVLKDGAPWFKASDVTKVLGYTNGPQAVHHNVQSKYIATREELCSTGSSPGGLGEGIYAIDTLRYDCPYPVDTSKTGRRGFPAASLYISEPGLYALILKSKKKEAQDFQDWVVGTVLPEIRAQGSYKSRKPQTKLQLCLINEFDLHAKVVDFVRRFHPEAIIVAGLGENQITDEMRIKSWQMGYTRGQCDLLLLNKHKTWTGMALELKSPTGLGVVSPAQQKFLATLAEAGYKTLLSNDYDEIIVQINEYFRDVRSFCAQCGRWVARTHTH